MSDDTAPRPLSKRVHLTWDKKAKIAERLKEVLEKFEDETVEYKDGLTDAAIAAEFPQWEVTTNHVSAIRQEAYGRLKMKTFGAGTAATARLDALEAEVDRLNKIIIQMAEMFDKGIAELKAELEEVKA